MALLAAEGRTNREVGAALFISPKTVELHLSRVYRKLDIRSRAELARMHGLGPGAAHRRVAPPPRSRFRYVACVSRSGSTAWSRASSVRERMPSFR